MTTNNPEVVAWWDGESSITRNVGRPAAHNWHQRIDLIRLSDYEALQAEFEEFKNKAHEWVRSGLELVDNAPRRFDFYYQKIEALRSDSDQQYDMKVKARAQRDEAARMLKAKEAESFALAATACHGGYGDDFGHFRCNYQDVIRKLQAECDHLRKDAARLDWLADPENQIGEVLLPTEVVEQNPHSMRDAIDAAMDMQQ